MEPHNAHYQTVTIPNNNMGADIMETMQHNIIRGVVSNLFQSTFVSPPWFLTFPANASRLLL